MNAAAYSEFCFRSQHDSDFTKDDINTLAGRMSNAPYSIKNAWVDLMYKVYEQGKNEALPVLADALVHWDSKSSQEYIQKYIEKNDGVSIG